jgi:RNA polymerase sigma-70 factor (ECF subfamily)
MRDQAIQSGSGRASPLAPAGVGYDDFAQTYRDNYAWVYGYLRARLLNNGDCDDLTQEVFLRAYAAHKRIDEQMGFRPWLFGIARNVLREHVRRQRRRKEVAWAEMCLELEAAIDEEGLHEDVLAELPDCLSQLGESANHALRWHYFDGERIDAISLRLGRTLGAVKVLMVRARQSLKRCLVRKLSQQAGAIPGGASAPSRDPTP